jgi:hypothetical protein
LSLFLPLPLSSLHIYTCVCGWNEADGGIEFEKESLVVNLHIRSRQAFEGIEAQASILDEDGAADLVGGDPALLKRDLFHGALQLGQVDILRVDRDGRFEDVLDLAQLVGVAGDEVDHWRCCHFFFWPPRSLLFRVEVVCCAGMELPSSVSLL